MDEEARRQALRRMSAAGARGIEERVGELAGIWAALRVRRRWEGVDADTAREAAGIAHKLAGAGGTFGYPAVSRVASSLEVMLGGLAVASAASPEVIGQTDQLVAALQDAFAAGPGDATGEGWSATGPPLAGEAGESAVLAVARGDRLDDLVATIGGLGFPVVPWPAGGAGAPPPAAAAAVIDGGGDPLGPAAELVGLCPTIVVADDVDLDLRLGAVRAGIDVVMAKPVDAAELADWLHSFVAGGGETPYSVLIVDDDHLLAETYAAALEQAGMVVGATGDPATAPDMISASFPDLVLMDVQMPGINGIELARVIRQSRRLLSVPIVFLSAEQDADRQLLARRFGGDDFIMKPVDLERLVTLVRLRAERARALRTAMEHDSLTGLLNHGRFKDRLEHELERARRGGLALSLAVLDLDRFKAVNDTHGHLAGDRVIRGLARTLRSRLRRIEMIGRYGGEEFGVILPDADPAAAKQAIDRVREAFAAQCFEADGNGAFQVTFSAGIASSRRHGDMNGLIAAADRALYEAKRAGRNRVVAEAADAEADTAG